MKFDAIIKVGWDPIRKDRILLRMDAGIVGIASDPAIIGGKGGGGSGG